jgi:AcrR family transcriptional regulator
MAAIAKQKSVISRTAAGAKGLASTGARKGRPPRGKTLISEERLLKTAIFIIDEFGVPALTMRHLAERLGVTAMSLYRYYDDHEALLDAIQRTIVEGNAPAIIEPGQGYREVVTETAKALRRAFKAHPRAVVLFATRKVHYSSRHVAAILERLQKAGFEPSIARYLIDAVFAFTIGLSLDEFARGEAKPGRPVQGHPGECTSLPLGNVKDYDTEFVVGLLAILDGFGSRFAKRAK